MLTRLLEEVRELNIYDIWNITCQYSPVVIDDIYYVFLVEHDDIERLSCNVPESVKEKGSGSVVTQDEPVVLKSFNMIPE